MGRGGALGSACSRSPRMTRFLASTFAAVTISDFLQLAYKAAEEEPAFEIVHG